MARTLKQWPSGANRSPKDPYPWADWFDGQIWELEQGRDFQRSTANFRAIVQAAATRRGVRVKTTVQDGGRTVVFQALTQEKS